MEWALSILLCSLRLGAMLLMTPIIDGFGIPPRVRVFIVLAFSMMLVSALPATASLPALEPWPLIKAATGELCTGALLGYGVLSAFAAFSFAGNLLDQQLGFSLANVFDPMTRSQSP